MRRAIRHHRAVLTRVRCAEPRPPTPDTRTLAPATPYTPLPPPLLLLDTYNLLHQWRGVPRHDAPGADLRALAALIHRSGVAEGSRVRMVCDGVAPGDGGVHLPGVEVVYAGGGHSADDVIIATLERSSAPSRITVVSSDRAVASAARRLGAKPVESGAFLSRLISGAARAGIERFQPKPLPALPLGDAEVGFWLREFGETVTHTEREAKPLPPEPRAKASRHSQPTTPHTASNAPPLRAPTTADPAPASLELGVHDAWLLEARRMWPDLTLDDLRMEKWLGGAASAGPTATKPPQAKTRRP